jgi:hypothetical protein
MAPLIITFVTGVVAWASGTVYSLRNRVTHAGGVWECIVPTISGTAPASGTVTATGIINTAASGNVMVEIPEFFVRIDWNDGLSWKNVAGADVDGEYKLLSPSGLSAIDPLRVYYVLPKAQYDSLGAGERTSGLDIQHSGRVETPLLIALYILTAPIPRFLNHRLIRACGMLVA